MGAAYVAGGGGIQPECRGFHEALAVMKALSVLKSGLKKIYSSELNL